jgi:hypothetical protein
LPAAWRQLVQTILVQAAWAAIEVNGGDLQHQCHRLHARRDARKARRGAVAASMLSVA